MVDSLLLDTTYLLPLFGIESGLSNFNESFRRLLSNYQLSYNPLSLVEAKWLVLKVAKKKRGRLQSFLDYYREGIGALAKESAIKKTQVTDENVEKLSDSLLTEAGLRDYFDRQIYSTAACSNTLLLTEDERLHKLYKSRAFQSPAALINWAELLKSRMK
jgi:PIN domain nuclease of toxin-antitoxin system